MNAADALARRYQASSRTEGKQLTAPESKTIPWEGCGFLTNDISFDSAYAQHFFDIYHREADFSVPHPVFLYAHGGGFVMGDKNNGDPAVPGITGIIRMIRGLLVAGFTVISANYCLAPDYRYPAPVLQMTELARFLQAHAGRYGLDMARVVVGGGSAGGHIMAQFAAIQTNPDYARELGIAPALGEGQLRAVYHGCALLDPERFGQTGDARTDAIFEQMGRCYFDAPKLPGDFRARQANVIAHVTADYPASYICDGNTATFNAQARDLAARLTELGVKIDAMIPDGPDEAPLPHGFDTLEYALGEESMRRMIAFATNAVFGETA